MTSFKISISVAIVIVAGLVLLFCFLREPKPIPRNVRILIDTTHSERLNHTLLDLNGNILEVTRLVDANPNTIEYFDMSLLDDFIESRNFLGFHGILRSEFIRLRASDVASIELSQEQLEDVWRRIDAVVRRYEQPEVWSGTNYTKIMAVIDGEFYFTTMGGRRTYPPTEVTRRARRDRRRSPFASFFDAYLIGLTHELIDLSPIPTGWERLHPVSIEDGSAVLEGD